MNLIHKILNRIFLFIDRIKIHHNKSKLDSSHFKTFDIIKNELCGNFNVDWEMRYIIENDSTDQTPFDRHYIYHPAWAARVVKKINPELHYDISSILYFGAIVSAFIPIKYFDYRPANLVLDQYDNNFADLLNLNFETNSIHSISCMHTIEHVGLGRYGEPIDANGDTKAMHELMRVVSPYGNLLIVVPIGANNVVMYNAHRIYKSEYIINIFTRAGFELIEFDLIPEDSKDGGLVNSPSNKLLANQKYACGCFWFKKLPLN